MNIMNAIVTSRIAVDALVLATGLSSSNDFACAGVRAERECANAVSKRAGPRRNAESNCSDQEVNVTPPRLDSAMIERAHGASARQKLLAGERRAHYKRALSATVGV